ncbi:uncharacterized protein C8R40DRAFT_1114687 [Lentinula edodes]|uniref:uncharacterized protein n=1 Tax=Lentinula edodes TaxID=5353 RepID=UPI001E8DF9DF|nr:uncharacterized protein C8R40DRAFT_1114687 [Lentinula edodes]KAH7873286.1 hypothetical protein C8R40DRAFT_1114687 [Lentinula edodes]
MTALYSPSHNASQDSRSGPLIFEPVIPQGSPRSSVFENGVRSVSRASLRSRSRSPVAPPPLPPPHSAPVIPNTPNSPLSSPRLSVNEARRLSASASPRALSPVTPGSPSENFLHPGYQPAFMSSRSRSATPEIFIPPLESSDPTPAPPTTDPIPVQEQPAYAAAPFWGQPYSGVSYPYFNYYPPQPYPYHSTPYVAPGVDMWPPPPISTPYAMPQFPQTLAAYEYPTPFNISTAHNTPFPSTPMFAMGPSTPWIPTTPWTVGSPAVRVNPRLAPGGLRWDLLHHPDQARYINDFGALKAPKFSDNALTMAPQSSGGPRMKVSKVEITSSSHAVLNYWMSIWGPIPLPHHKVFDVLSAVYNYLAQPLTAQETKLLLDTPQNVGHALRAKEARANDSWALACVILQEEGYRRIDVIGVHRGFGGISVEKITPTGLPAAAAEGNDEPEQEAEVELTIALSPLPGDADENWM